MKITEMTIDEARNILIRNFKHEYKSYIKNTLAGDFAVILVEKLNIKNKG